MSLKSILQGLIPASLQPKGFAEAAKRKLRESNIVAAGPCRGMKFVWEAWDQNFTLPIPKFLGSYERELYPVFEKMFQLSPDLVIDVGAADGYYAVGFAMRLPKAKVLAFEEIPEGQAMVSRVAKMNGVADRVISLGRCELDDLQKAITDAKLAFVMIDVEGFEKVLMDPIAIPALKGALLLIECHDCYVPGVTETLKERFAATHSIQVIPARVRSLDDLETVSPFLKWYSKYSVLGWTEERMHPTTWLYMTPKK